MKALMKEVQQAVENELSRANEKFPLFHSTHEGWAVIQEEVKEMDTVLEAMGHALNDFTEDVFRNKDTTNMVRMIKEQATYAAAELIQVAAMCRKF